MMKTNFFLIVVIFSVLSLSAQDMQLYPFKSGMIKYKFEGRTKGTEIIYFDEYGKLLSNLKISLISYNNKTEQNSILKIYKYDSLIELNLKNKTATINSLSDNLIKSKQNLISQDMIKTMGFIKSGFEKIAGLNCEKYSGENGNLWVWKNIVLKSELEIMGTKITTEAIELVTDIKISKSKYKIPKEFKIINNQ